jgi:hypothetical protein
VFKLVLVEFPASRLAVLQFCRGHHVDLPPSSTLSMKVTFAGTNTKTGIPRRLLQLHRREQMKTHPHVHELQVDPRITLPFSHPFYGGSRGHR